MKREQLSPTGVESCHDLPAILLNRQGSARLDIRGISQALSGPFRWDNHPRHAFMKTPREQASDHAIPAADVHWYRFEWTHLTGDDPTDGHSSWSEALPRWVNLALAAHREESCARDAAPSLLGETT